MLPAPREANPGLPSLGTICVALIVLAHIQVRRSAHANLREDLGRASGLVRLRRAAPRRSPPRARDASPPPIRGAKSAFCAQNTALCALRAAPCAHFSETVTHRPAGSSSQTSGCGSWGKPSRQCRGTGRAEAHVSGASGHFHYGRLYLYKLAAMEIRWREREITISLVSVLPVNSVTFIPTPYR